MNLLVCLKEFSADSTQYNYDAYALEAALRLKDEEPETAVGVLTMGPPSSADMLRECLALGADTAYLISGSEFSGSDTLATSQVLSHAISHLSSLTGGFDAVFCGFESDSGQTAQVGPELAERLHIPCISNALDCSVSGRTLLVRRYLDSDIHLFEVSSPCVITFTQSRFDIRNASMSARILSRMKEIPVLTCRDLGLSPEETGFSGSQTTVINSVSVKNRRGKKYTFPEFTASLKKVFFFDQTLCIGCGACQAACKSRHNPGENQYFRKAVTSDYPDGPVRYSGACNHCENPKCTEACPTGAMYKAADGTVQHDDGKCIGCGACVWNCPYGAPSLSPVTGLAAKCDLCADLRRAGKNPACVDACVTRCLRYCPPEELKAEFCGDPLVSTLPFLPDDRITSPSLLIRPSIRSL